LKGRLEGRMKGRVKDRAKTEGKIERYIGMMERQNLLCRSLTRC